MKKALLLIAVLFLTALASYAQTEKGSQTLGVDLGFTYLNSTGITVNPYDNSNYNSSNKSTRFNIGPSYSYFIGDKLDLGTSLSYSQNTYSYPPGNNLEKQSERDFGGAIYLRKYFMFQEKIGLRAGPRVGYYHDVNKTTYGPSMAIYNENTTTDNFVGGLNLDLVYYPSKHLGFTASLANLYYTHYKSNSGTQGNAKGDNFNASFINDGLSLSIFYAFGR
ncbi:MAG TPA: outer membrane beta-barrel protein [Mucilaginibacter sp.]